MGGRGVPKNFLDFGRFSKFSKDFGKLSKCLTKCSQPTLLEGFALRSRKSRSVFRSSDPFGKVIVLLVRGPCSSLTLVRGDITRMAEEDISSVESLFSLVESMDFDLQMGDLGESLMTEAELVANLPDDFLNPLPLPPPTTSPPQAPPPTPSFPVLQLSSTIPTNHIRLRQVGEPGPDGQVVFEVVTDNLQLPLDDLPNDLGYNSLPSSSSSVSPVLQRKRWERPKARARRRGDFVCRRRHVGGIGGTRRGSWRRRRRSWSSWRRGMWS